MTAVDALAHWLEATRIAAWVGGSMWVLATLSALHVLGYALVMGGALFGTLRRIGLMVPSVPLQDVVAPASRAITWGLLASIVTGILLVASKAVAAFANDIFRVKMLLMLVAALLHFSVQRRGHSGADGRPRRGTAAVELLSWLGLAGASAAYILFE